MDRYYSIMKQTVDLAETCLEALVHINTKLSEGYFEVTIPLLEDVLNAFYMIEKSIQPILPNLLTDQLEPLTETLRNKFDSIVLYYEQKDWSKAIESMELLLLPGYKKWQAELDQSLLPYLLS